jgi:hypothetical protein
MARDEDRLADVTCWLGHRIDQEQWVHRTRIVEGREVDEYETRCDCGETITVLMEGGCIVGETSDCL